MKSLKEYLINEKLKINKNVNNLNLINVPIPKCDDGSWEVSDTDKIWKTIKVPFKKYVIFIDRYRFNHAHFAVLSDFLCQLTGFQNDYEDYTPDKYVLYASDELDDIFKWYAKYLNIEGLHSENEIERRVNGKTADGVSFLLDMLNDNLKESDFFGLADAIPNEKDYKNWPEYFTEHY